MHHIEDLRVLPVTRFAVSYVWLRLVHRFGLKKYWKLPLVTGNSPCSRTEPGMTAA